MVTTMAAWGAKMFFEVKEVCKECGGAANIPIYGVAFTGDFYCLKCAISEQRHLHGKLGVTLDADYNDRIYLHFVDNETRQKALANLGLSESLINLVNGKLA